MKRILIGLYGLVLSLSLSAGGMGEVGNVYEEQTISSYAKIVTISAGPAFYTAGESQPIILPSGGSNLYVANRPMRTLGSGEIFFGLGMPLIENLYGQLGLAVAYSGEGQLSGTTYARIRTYEYLYRGSNTRVSVKGKLLPDWRYWLKPYLSAGIGAGFNQNYGFHVNPNYITAPRFTEHTTVGFSVTAGVGLEARLTEHWGGGIGYEFANWGKTSLGPINNSATNVLLYNSVGKGIKLGHFYTNELLVSISYFL